MDVALLSKVLGRGECQTVASQARPVSSECEVLVWALSLSGLVTICQESGSQTVVLTLETSTLSLLLVNIVSEE